MISRKVVSFFILICYNTFVFCKERILIYKYSDEKMKINQKLYVLGDSLEPIEVQEFDGRKIELYYLEDEVVKTDFINKSQFAVWSSVDGKNYRLFLEEGYYNAVPRLYSKDVNQIWVNFWDTTEAITQKTSRFILIPMMVVCIGLCVASFFIPGNTASYIIIGILIAAFIAMIVVNSMTRKKVMAENMKSRDLIAGVLGQDEFDNILKTQKDYMDAYYQAMYPDDEPEEETEEVAEETKEETTVLEEPKAEEATEEVKEEKTEEVKEETKEE